MDLSNEPMNIQTALEYLNISLNDISIADITTEYLKKQYHKQALKWHPDKNKNSNYTDLETTNKFQKINESYEYLLKEICTQQEDKTDFSNTSDFVSSSSFKETNNYSNILSSFILSIIKGNYKEGISHIIQTIILNYDSISVTLFTGLDKENAVEIYSLLCKYKDVFNVPSKTLELVSSIIKEKYKNDKVYILKPNISDLLDNKIYKLYVDDELYLVPLWHNELYFDCNDGTEIIVLCQPELEENIVIDENNNIYCTINVIMDNEFRNKINNLTNPYVSFEIGNKLFKISYDKLYIKKEQTYKFRKSGISQIQENDIYNVSLKGDIIVKIILE